MKAIINLVFRPLAALALLLFAGGWLAGCNTLQEDYSHCPQGAYLRFHYTLNTSYSDLLAQQVNTLDIFAYHISDGTLAQHVHVAARNLDAAQGIKLLLDPGSYRIVVWGNYAPADHILSVHENCEEVKLRLNNNDGDVTTLCSLFHAMTELEVVRNSETRREMYLTKNTNAVHVIMEEVNGTGADLSAFTVTLTGTNGIYNYDNSLAAECPSLPLNYIPSFSTGDEGWAQANFNVLRLFSDESDGLNLKIVANSHPRSPLYELKLTREILRAIPDVNTMEDLDRHDDYTLRYVVRDTGGAWTVVKIFINGWEIVQQGSGM